MKYRKLVSFLCVGALLAGMLVMPAGALSSDEILSQIDDTRAKNILQMLSEYTKNGTQCLLFTCHSREGVMSDAPAVKM